MRAAVSGSAGEVLRNPYLDFFSALPPAFRRNPWVPVSTAELFNPGWLSWKASVCQHFAWAVPTESAILAIRRHAKRVVEIGAGSGYWAWLMRQAGIDVVAFDASPAPFTWTDVVQADEHAGAGDADTLLLCWPPWGTDMAYNALASHRGELAVFVGEWMGGCATPEFFRLLQTRFEAVDAIAIPQWYMRCDFLAVFKRRTLLDSVRR